MKNRHAQALSKLGSSKGGTARASSLTPTRRAEIARLAANARWNKCVKDGTAYFDVPKGRAKTPIGSDGRPVLQVPKKFWSSRERGDVERPDVVSFLTDLALLCRKHDKSLSHEDTHGGFVVEPWSRYRERWLLDTSVEDRPAYDR